MNSCGLQTGTAPAKNLALSFRSSHIIQTLLYIYFSVYCSHLDARLDRHLSAVLTTFDLFISASAGPSEQHVHTLQSILTHLIQLFLTTVSLQNRQHSCLHSRHGNISSIQLSVPLYLLHYTTISSILVPEEETYSTAHPVILIVPRRSLDLHVLLCCFIPFGASGSAGLGRHVCVRR